MIEAMLRTALMVDQRLQALMDDPRPAFVWHLDGRSLVWANRAGGDSLGLSPADIVRQESNAAVVALSSQIAAIARKLPRPGAMRLERLRLPGMGALDTLACACRSFAGPEGFLGLMVQALDPPRRGRRPPAWAPPSVVETLPPLAAPEPQPEAPVRTPYERKGAWSWVDQEGERGQAARPADPPARPAAAEPVRIPRDRPVRFVFHTDAAGRFVSVSSDLASVLGKRAEKWVGKRFEEIAAEEGFRGGEAIGAAFAARETWTALTFLWRDEGRREETMFTLSAAPVFRRRLFAGFRGFGIADPPRPLAVLPAVAALPAPIEVSPPAIVWQEAEPGEDDERDFPPAPSNPVIDIAEARNARQPAGGKVVRLHGKPGSGERHGGLTPTERNAFHEIARALGARIEGGMKPLPEPASRPEAAAPAAPPPADEEAARQAEDEAMWRADIEAEPAPEEPAFEEPAFQEPRPRDAADASSGQGRLEEVPVALIDRLPIGIFVARGDELQFANRTMLDLLGYEDIDAIHRAGGLDNVFAGTGLVSLSAGEEACYPGVLLRTAAGETIVVDGRVQTTQWCGESALLISVRRPAAAANDEKLRFAERKADELQAVLDTATDGVVILDVEGRIISINRSAEALFGYEQREVAGKDLLLLFAPESHRAAFDYLDSLRANGVASLLNDGREVMGRVRQGGSVPLFMTIGRLGDDGKRLCAVLRDVTSFKKAEGELVAAKRQAEEASSQKSDFLAKISHEVRTPLNAIIGFAEVMMEERFGPMGNERYRSYARDIHTSGEHVISLVNDLLDLSKIEAGRLDLAFTSVNLNEVVQQSVSLMQPQASRDRIIIRMALANGLPNVVADIRSMRQIVLNLLSNSIKFTQAGGQAIISTTLSERGEAVLRVRDTGVGMTERELAIAMEPFRQVASTTLGGTGLGLPLTKALVEANRAAFTIQSTKHAGTLVEVIFPPTRVLAE
ncbi:PAS domain-containing sensor histidine kinase [Labrys monachus]|uniref:histidine kinase n=1 Tax=Labrys monachus TaxID=217067 RepID=A0ABU0FF80_9HYPH|nr:PAS domain S-box protein [Labrys monachus]MDQ0392700.1 PAS domain S-box-containing protein [Labrys monachus]